MVSTFYFFSLSYFGLPSNRDFTITAQKKFFIKDFYIFCAVYIIISQTFSPILLRSFAKDFQYQFNVEIQRKMRFKSVFNPAGNYIFKVNNRNTRTKV